ncbi:MAG TPA: HAD family hydrolase [Gemmatimonadales bacterium]|nr:HAD family hydrolase [Gemmatimonadales bacterium]
MSAKLVLFDIDGTLLLTAGAGRRAITTVLAEHVAGVTEPAAAPDLHACFAAVRFDGKTDPQIVGELLAAAGEPAPHDAGRVRSLCERYVRLLEHELRHPEARTTVMPGVPALLDALEREPGVVLGLLTGNLLEGAGLKLRAAGLDPARFAIGAYGSDAAHRPELPPIAARRAAERFGARFGGRAPDGHAVVIIGDTPADVTCGRSIGARAIAVATGAYSMEDLAAAGPHAVFADLSDTAAVLAAILG